MTGKWEKPSKREPGMYWVRHQKQKVLRIMEYEAERDLWHNGPASLTTEEWAQWGIEVWSERIEEPPNGTA